MNRSKSSRQDIKFGFCRTRSIAFKIYGHHPIATPCPLPHQFLMSELLSNLVFEGCRSCGDLVWVCGFNSVFERDAGDDFGEVIKAA